MQSKLWCGPLPLVALGAAAIVGAGMLLATGGVSAQEHRLHPGRDAFSKIQVDSTDELVGMLRRNPALRRNYARHFGIPESRVVQFVKEALVPYTLPKDRSVQTYGLTKTGSIYPVQVRLKKGTRVWATRSGTPVLKWLCSNPVTTKLPGTDLKRAAVAPVDKAPSAVRVASLGPTIPDEPDGDLLPAPATPEAPPVLVADVPEVVAPETLVGDASAAAPAIAFPSGSSGGRVPILPLAGLVGYVAATSGGGGSSLTPVNAVPEPGAVALMAIGGLLGLPLLRRRR